MKKRPPAAATATDSLIADVFRSPEYLASLKARLLSGSAKASEIMVARELGLMIPVNDGLDGERDAMRAMDTQTRRRLTDMLRLMNTVEGARRFRCIDAPGVVGIGYVTTLVPVDPGMPTSPEPPTDDETLMPPTVQP